VNGNPENVGRCAVFNDIGETVYHNDHIIRVRFDPSMVSGVYASALLNSSYGKSEMKDKIKTSAGQYTINQIGIGEIRAPLPPLDLQNRFAEFAEAADKSKFVASEATKTVARAAIIAQNTLNRREKTYKQEERNDV
jgi:restriction endonuclease S subunit